MVITYNTTVETSNKNTEYIVLYMYSFISCLLRSLTNFRKKKDPTCDGLVEIIVKTLMRISFVLLPAHHHIHCFWESPLRHILSSLPSTDRSRNNALKMGESTQTNAWQYCRRLSETTHITCSRSFNIARNTCWTIHWKGQIYDTMRCMYKKQFSAVKSLTVRTISNVNVM